LRPPSRRVKPPGDLKPAHVPRAMQQYFDTNLAKIGGAKALDTIPDPRVAAAIADTLYRDGPGKGANSVQNAVEGAGVAVSKDGVLGTRTMEAIRHLSVDPDSSRRFLDALGAARSAPQQGDKIRNDHFRFR
jgi:hypothetical protein